MNHLPDRLLDVLCYLYLVGFVEFVCFGVGAVAGLLALPFIGWDRYVRGLRRTSVFLLLLLAFGAVANSAWMLLAYGRWYVSADTVVDFWPFIPFGQWVLDQTFGSYRGSLLGGAQLWQLRLLWFVLAAAVWMATVRSYLGIRPRSAQPFVPADAPEAARR